MCRLAKYEVGGGLDIERMQLCATGLRFLRFFRSVRKNDRFPVYPERPIALRQPNRVFRTIQYGLRIYHGAIVVLRALDQVAVDRSTLSATEIRNLNLRSGMQLRASVRRNLEDLDYDMLPRDSLVVDLPCLAFSTGLGATEELLRPGTKPDALSAEERFVLEKPHVHDVCKRPLSHYGRDKSFRE